MRGFRFQPKKCRPRANRKLLVARGKQTSGTQGSNNILLMRKRIQAFLLLAIALA